MTPKAVGHFEILEGVGEGGMGTVYRARDNKLQRTVAIKFLSPVRVSDPERQRRFIQEAQAASALNHPNIVTVHEITAENGTFCIVMEYVPGKPRRIDSSTWNAPSGYSADRHSDRRCVGRARIQRESFTAT